MEAAIYQILRDNGYEDEEIDASFDTGETEPTESLSEKHEDMLLLLRKDDLKSEARKRHLPLTGNKIDLVLN